MKKIIILLTALSLPLSILCAEEEKNDNDQKKSSNLTPNAPRPVTMANPNKPAWLAEPHGK
jgi:hypothetical protein